MIKRSGKLLNFVQTYGVRYDKNRIHSDSTDASGLVFTSVTCRSSDAIVKMNEAMSPLWNYFEVEIITHEDNTAVGIGVGAHDNTLHGMPGWTARSFGYHSDDGKLFHQSGVGLRFGPTCIKGDIMGCGIDYDGLASTGYVRLWFTKNSTVVGAPVRAKVPPKGFHSLIGMHYLGNHKVVKYLGHSQQKTPYSLQVLGEYVFLLYLLLSSIYIM